MLNADATGFYRVLYDAELTLLIQRQLRNDPSKISPLSRTQLLDDYFNLAYKGIFRNFMFPDILHFLFLV